MTSHPSFARAKLQRNCVWRMSFIAAFLVLTMIAQSMQAAVTLTLQVDTTTGATTLLGDASESIDIDYYEITSAGNSLDLVNWVSLQDQDFEGNGPPSGTGDGWEELAGIGAHALAEEYLLGSSTSPADASIGLGMGYDISVDARDLVFSYRSDAGFVFQGVVDYGVIPEPTRALLLLLGAVGVMVIRRRRA